MNYRVKHTVEDNLITRQNRAEKDFLAKFEKDKPTLENATVIVNPYLINPLCAMILFKTDKAVAPTLTVHGKNNAREDITHTFPKGTSHLLPVLCLYENMETKVTIKLDSGEEKTFAIKAQPLPGDIFRCRNIFTSIDYFGTNIMFLSPSDKNYPIGFDYKGEIRWLLTETTMFDIKRLKNGHLMTGSSRFYHMPYNSTGLIEINLLGKIYRNTACQAAIIMTILKCLMAISLH